MSNLVLNYALTNTSSTISNVVYYDQVTYPYSGGQWVPQTVAPAPSPVEGALLPEDPIAWLRRRVDEVCWKPS